MQNRSSSFGELNSYEKGEYYYFRLPTLPKGFVYVVNRRLGTLDLVKYAASFPRLIEEPILTKNEIQAFLSIVESFPQTCLHEILLSRIISLSVDLISVGHWLQRLEEARNHGTLR